MKCLAFADRNRKEFLRDPLTLIFGIGFPVILILLIALMKNSIQGMPDELFPMESFAPGMAVFGLSFLSLFLGTLISNDRNSSFLMRIFASPLTSADYIIGYSIWLFPISIIQSTVCFLTASFFGLSLNVNTLVAIVVLLPVAALFISMGLLLGAIFTYRQVGGIASIIVNISAWFSGTWFDLNLIGGTFKNICYFMPFAHAVDSVKLAISGDYNMIFQHMTWVLTYTIILFIIAIFVFKRKVRN